MNNGKKSADAQIHTHFIKFVQISHNHKARAAINDACSHVHYYDKLSKFDD